MNTLAFSGGGTGLLIYIIFMGLLVYFMLIRPNKKRQEQQQELINSQAVGDHAVTIGGLHGIIAEIDEVNNTITLDCEGIVLVFDRRAIARTEKGDPFQTEAANDAITNDAKEAELAEEAKPEEE
ncbi:preprotein translocase subunit YajC [Aerococcus urinaehominis]|uniref:Preprotein translocase subunit YajC n=1 Tax=Aerococcus urinaehominis TaxID=128944 RepID=A0A120IAS2_9LACT|nr:preprotein translocase subunit YajC [Aerococcus urinaehominis]AMB98935.1 preprotein translocase subunit YajC [Aerococcus urinaehominis]SDM40316.1 preprotein translocase subunit YajC [Aerococcus urinaehominis]